MTAFLIASYEVADMALEWVLEQAETITPWKDHDDVYS